MCLCFKTVSVALSSLFLLAFASCGEKYITTSGNTWGTSYHITYRGTPSLSDSVIDVFAHIDNELSMFNPNSTVSRINRGETTATSSDLRHVFRLSAEVSAASGGLYDPTVAPLTDLWGFGRNRPARIPDSAEVTAVLPLVGIAGCTIGEDGSLTKKHPATEFDFSSIAKGYGIDCVGLMFERSGVDDYMIEVGGEILVRGLNPRGEKWRIQIDNPEVADTLLHNRLKVVEMGPEREALATSGNYRNFRTDSLGRRYGHTLSPVTGYPAETTILSVTVKAPGCGLADALATASMLIPVNEITPFLDQFGAEAIVIVE